MTRGAILNQKTEPTKEQIQKLWEWCVGGDKLFSRTTDGTLVISYEPIDLNNLFKYAVPKIYDYLCRKGDYYKIKRIYKSLEYKDKLGKYNPELALFWAIWEVIK